MDKFLAYYTQDGSVGLYSKENGDIYHSVFGAYSEAYDKFIIPSNIEDLFKTKDKINVLDLCYGIGYNTKSFLNYFLENFSQKKINKFNSHAENNYAIDTDNILSKCNNEILEKNEKEILIDKSCNDQIYTNNILNENLEEKNNFIENNSKKEIQFNQNDKSVSSNKYKKYEINIDAIDLDFNLMRISPLLKNKKKLFKQNKTGIDVVDKYLSVENKNKKHYKYNKQVNYIIAKNLIDNFKGEYFDNDFENFLKNKNVYKYFDKNLLYFMPFYLKSGYNLSSLKIKSTFLHNIYYRYISKSYKKAMNTLTNHNININYICDDARCLDNYEFKRYDLIFLDAFTPTKCPSLWTYDFFKLLYQHINFDGMILTYSNSASIRNAFLQNGFYVGKIFNENENKYTGTIATKNPDLIKHKLSDYDIGLTKTKAGLVFSDKTLSLDNSKILKQRETELKESSLESSSHFIKRFLGDNNEI